MRLDAVGGHMLDQPRKSDERDLRATINDSTPSKRADCRGNERRRVPRRLVLKTLTGLGVGSAVFQRALAAQADGSTAVTAEMIQQAEWIAGIELNPEDRASTAR